MSENILEVKGLTKDYGDFVLDKLTFTVPKGVIMGLIGENGAGKSTTINCILNEISKTDGNIEIFGKDYLSEEIEIKDKIGVVFDENHLGVNAGFATMFILIILLVVLGLWTKATNNSIMWFVVENFEVSIAIAGVSVVAICGLSFVLSNLFFRKKYI